MIPFKRGEAAPKGNKPLRLMVQVLITALAVAGSVLFGATFAHAHTANIKAAAVCEGGQYKITFTLKMDNVPAGATATVLARTGGQSFHNGWNKGTWSDWETIATNVPSNQSTVTWTRYLPGDTTGNGPWEYAVTEWSTNYSVKADTRIENLKGDCFNWDWKYANPSCDGLTVKYPSNIPSGSDHKDVNIRIKNMATGQVVTFNFHDSNFDTKGKTVTYKVTDHPNWPGWTWYEYQWTQVHGTNYHWEGSIICGSEPHKVSVETPTWNDVCGTEDDTITLPSNTADVTYSVAGNVVTATLVGSPEESEFGTLPSGWVKSNDERSASYTVTFTDEECPETIVTQAVVFVDHTCKAIGSVTAPAVDGVRYEATLDGTVVGFVDNFPAGKFYATDDGTADGAPFYGDITITAHPVSDTDTLDGVTEWTHKFKKAAECDTPPPPELPHTGAANVAIPLIAGGLLLGAGVPLLWWRRKQSRI